VREGNEKKVSEDRPEDNGHVRSGTSPVWHRKKGVGQRREEERCVCVCCVVGRKEVALSGKN
jgi:hypothetical protein